MRISGVVATSIVRTAVVKSVVVTCGALKRFLRRCDGTRQMGLLAEALPPRNPIITYLLCRRLPWATLISEEVQLRILGEFLGC